MLSILHKTYLFYNFSSILKFYKLFCFDVSQKFLISNLYFLSKIFRIVCTLSITNSLKNETDIKIINSLLILDMFFQKKTGISSLFQKYLRKSKNIIFVCNIVLSHFVDFYLFFFLIKKIVKPSLLKRYFFIKYKFLLNGFVFYVPDISMISGLSEELKKEKISIKISFFFNIKNQLNKSKHLLKNLIKYIFI